MMQTDFGSKTSVPPCGSGDKYAGTSTARDSVAGGVVVIAARLQGPPSSRVAGNLPSLADEYMPRHPLGILAGRCGRGWLMNAYVY